MPSRKMKRTGLIRPSDDDSQQPPEDFILPEQSHKVETIPEGSSSMEPDFEMMFIIGAILLALLAFYIGYQMMQPDWMIFARPRSSVVDYSQGLEAASPSTDAWMVSPGSSSKAPPSSVPRKPSGQQSSPSQASDHSLPQVSDVPQEAIQAQPSQQAVSRRASSLSQEDASLNPCTKLGLSKDFLGDYNYYAFIRTPLKAYRKIAMNVGGDRCVFYLTDGVIQDVADVGKEVADVDFYLSPDKFSACQSAFQSKDKMALMSCMGGISTIPSSAKQSMCESAISQFSPMEQMVYGQFCE